MSKITALFAALLFVGTLAGAVVAEGEAEGERPDRLVRLQEHIEKRLARLADFRENLPDDADTSRLDALKANTALRRWVRRVVTRPSLPMNSEVSMAKTLSPPSSWADETR
jgi:cytochrome c556